MRQSKRHERLARNAARGVEAWRSGRQTAPARSAAQSANGHSSNGHRPARLNGARARRYQRPVPGEAVPLPAAHEPGVMAALPRSRFLTLRAGEANPPKMRRVMFETRRSQALGRLLIWLITFLRYLGGIWLDQVRGLSTPQRRAVRLRKAFERMGGTGVKIGQYLAMRLDFLPWVYCVELAQMLDKMPPFPAEAAVAAIERRTGRPLGQTFARFDPDPVRSDSVACVYQGLLREGQPVVVRVRRPGVGQLFMADLQVLDWLLLAVEFLTILRPGSSQQMRREFRSAVLGSLDFVQEARFQDSFRRAARRSGKDFFTAPRVYFDYCAEDVIVEEFVGGMWMWELLAGMDQKNQRVLDLARELNIDPAQVARRLMWINYWSWDASFFFHADPHPDNIIIGRDGRLTFLGFSSVGSIEPEKRAAMHQNMYCFRKQDPLGMARALVTLLAPLPPLDVLEFTKEIEAYNWQMLYVHASRKRNRSWTDRALAIQLIGLFRVAAQYGVSMDFQVLRLLRTSLLYDTLAARLQPDIDLVREYRRFDRYRARRAQRRILRSAQRQLDQGFDQKIFLRLERVANMTDNLFARLRHVLAIPSANYNALVGKGSHAIFTLVAFAVQALAVTVLFLGLGALGTYLMTGALPNQAAVIERLLTNPWYQVLVLILFILNTRTVLFHLDDVDVG